MSGLYDLIRRSNANGRITAPESDDPWAAQVRGAAPQALVAIATGSRARAIRAEERVVELEAELAAAAQGEPAPDPKSTFHQKNAVLLDRIIGRPATNQKD